MIPCATILVIILGIGIASDCSPNSYPYTLEIVYTENAQSQTVEIYQVHNRSTEYIASYSGYGKDYHIEVNEICLMDQTYEVICMATLADSWADKSFFVIKAFGITPVLRGTVDMGRMAVYYFHPYPAISPSDSWRWKDFSVPFDWYTTHFDDSEWDLASPGSFIPLPPERFYRRSVHLTESMLSQFPSFELYLKHFNGIEVFVNGLEFLSLPSLSGDLHETVKRGSFSTYIQSLMLTVAIHTMSDDIARNITADPFSAHLIFLTFRTPSSEQIAVNSDHRRDYPNHPVDVLFDENRKTSWWFSGEQAYVEVEFTSVVGEFVNQYMLTSNGDSGEYDPKSWQLFGSFDKIDYFLLDSRKEEVFDYRMQQRYFPINNSPQSYKFYLLRICTHSRGYIHVVNNRQSKRMTRLNQFSLVSDFVKLKNSLEYEASYTFYYQFDRFHIAPLSSGYSHFSLINTILPHGVQFDSISGAFYGDLPRLPRSWHVTVAGEDMLDHTRSQTSFSVSTLDCSGNSVMIGVRQHNSIISHIECWTLEAGNQTISNCGYDGLTEGSELLHYFCISNNPFKISSYINQALLNQYRLQHRSQGFISILIVTPLSHSSIPNTNIATLSISDYTRTCTVNPMFIINSTTIWRYNPGHQCDDRWNQVQFDDSTWPIWPSHEPYRGPLCFRTWIHLDSVENYTSLEFRLLSSSRLILCVNEDCPIDEQLNKKTWSLYTITPESLHEGDNLVSYLVIPQKTHYSNDYPPAYVRLRLITESEECSRPISGKATGSSMAGYSVSNLFDNRMEKIWKNDFVEGKASATFTFNAQHAHMFNRYCLTNAFDEEMDPQSWDVYYFVRRGSMTWINVDHQNHITWSNRYQEQCFITASPHQLVYAIMIKIQPAPKQTHIQLTHWRFHYVKRGNMETTDLRYPSTTIRAFTEMPIQMLCPEKPYFWGFNISTALPRGLKINQGTGCISGKIEEGFESRSYSIVALNLRHIPQMVEMRVEYVTCTFPNSPISLVLERTQDEESPLTLEIALFSSSWVPIRFGTLYLNSESSSVFGHCLEPDMYYLTFADFSNQGDLNLLWSLSQNGYLLRNSRFNPGYTHVWQDVKISDDFDNDNTEWYYHVDSSEVESDWFKTINPPIETWESAIPANIPSVTGIAQYFKTVLYLSNLEELVSLQFSFRILAGIVFYINGHEYHRFNLPDSKITSHTIATDAFDHDVMYTVAVPIQYSSLIEGRNIIAVETHLTKKPTISIQSSFQVKLTFLANHNPVMQNVIAMDETPLSSEKIVIGRNTTSVSAIVDHNYYSQYFKESNCTDQVIYIFTDLGQPEFVTELRFFFGEGRGLYPHNLQMYGRMLYSLHEIEMAKKGAKLDNRDWVKLMDVNIVMSGSYGLGTKKDFNFYNEIILNEFRIVMNDCEFGHGFEIGEIEFFSSRNEGFCDVHNITESRSISRSVSPSQFVDFIPTHTWFRKECPDLYEGAIEVYCLNGNWTNKRENCKPLPPVFCRYGVTVLYIGIHKEVSIFPKVKGAEMTFMTENIPEGLTLNPETGEISGIIRHVIPLTEIHVKCVNLGGEIETTLAVMTVNNHEMVLIIIAGVMIVVFVLTLLGIVRLLNRKTLIVVDENNQNGKLHVDGLSNEMRSLLL